MQERPSRCQDQPSDRRGGKRRKYHRCTAALCLLAGALLALNTTQALPVQELRYPPVQRIKRQDQTSPLPGTGGAQGTPETAGDPCSALANAIEPNITFDLVKACFENIPYSKAEADTILTTLYTYYKDFYIFVDAAQLPNQQKPFTNPPVDILAELRQLGQRSFPNDFEFHRQVDLAVNKLNDAHANYMPSCYQHYLYVQPLELYAPVIDGVQSVKILTDNYSPSGTTYRDCTVLKIDGEDALPHIQKWVDIHNGFSKDAGVRLNKAMTQLIFSTEKMDWIYYAGLFTTRVTLPEWEKMEFTVQCSHKTDETQEEHAPGSNSDISPHNNEDVQQGQTNNKQQPAGRVAQVVVEEEEHKKKQTQTQQQQQQQQPGNVETLSLPWSIYRLVSWKEFSDTPTFVQANCLVLPPEPEETVTEEPQQQNSTDNEQDDDDDDDENVDKQLEEVEKELQLVDELEDLGDGGEKTQGTGIDTLTHRHVKRTTKPTRSISDMQGQYYAESMERQSRATILERRQAPGENGAGGALPPLNDRAARLVYNSTFIAFYQLVKRPEVGVVVIPSHMIEHAKESKNMVGGFELLRERGVQKLILDLTNNGGGYVNFAYDLVDWMFPNETRTSVYESDLRASMSIKALADMDLAMEDYDGYFNPASFSDPTSLEEFDTNFFLDDRLERRAQSSLGYTKRVLMNHDLGKFDLGMPWQHHAQDMVLLTDGTCGSACGMSLNRLKNRHGVRSYAIGGRAAEDLSLFSFAGASVYGLDDLITDFETLKVDSPLRRMRYRGIYRVPVMEFFQEDDPLPIEYHPSLYKADVHLDFTPETARHHEKFWEIIAEQQWQPKPL